MLAAVLLVVVLVSLSAQAEGLAMPNSAPPTRTEAEAGFEWRPALLQSGVFLGIQHAGRMLQKKTRRELGGPFWSDYFESASSIRTWSDQDGIPTNYLGHPMMGAIAGYIQVFNDPQGRRLQFDPKSQQYWKSRFKAMAWSAAYSTQYEIGPLSEASIGNVGKRPPTMAVVDLVVTPVGGFGLMLLEDYLDKRFISRLERSGGFKARVYRIVLNPCRSITNVLRLKLPSYRDLRPLPTTESRLP